MKPGIVTQFRVKRERNIPALFDSNDTLIKPREDTQCRAGPGDNRGTDEDSMERSSIKTCERETDFK